MNDNIFVSKSAYEQTDYDRNNDGQIDMRDIPPETRKDIEGSHWDDPVPDERANIRRLKSLRAADILEERARRREEALADKVIAEEEKHQREANKHPARRGAERAIAILGEAARSYMPEEAPRRAAPPRQVRRVSARPPPPAAADMRNRFTSMNDRTNDFGSRLLGAGGGGTAGGPSHVDHFAANLLPRRQEGRADLAPQRGSVRQAAYTHQQPHIDPLKAFAQSALVGNMQPRIPRQNAPIPRQQAPVQAPKPPCIRDFNAKMLGGTKGKKPRGIRMF